MTTDIQKIASQHSKLRSVTIDGSEYQITLLPALEGLNVGKRLLSVVLPIFASLFEGEKRKDLVLPEDDSMMTELALILVGQLDGLDETDIAARLLSKVYKDGVEIDINEALTAKYSVLIQLLEFSIKENFSDFFTDYLKAKGFDLQTLREVIQKVEEPQKSND